MTKLLMPEHLNQFEKEKLCHLLECNDAELTKFYERASAVFQQTDTTYDALLKILHQGNNVREATLAGLLCGKLIGFSEAKAKIELDIKDKLFNAFKNNRTF
jgi:sensor histidine kinase regulating citrate/malate metabolism